MRLRFKILLAIPVAMLFILAGVAAFFFYATSRTQGHYLDADGVRIHYTDEGRGYPLILVHGVGAHADLNWRRGGMVAKLAQDFRVVTFDLRGHGLSDRPNTPDAYGIELVNDVVRLMDHLEIDRAHVAGYSLGGFITLKLVATHPERIQSAAFCASGWANPEFNQESDDLHSPYWPPPDEAVQRVQKYAMAPFNFLFLVDWVRDYLGDTTLDKASAKALKKSYRELIVTEEELRAIAVPSICFMGTADGLLPYAVDMKERMPALKFVVLEGAGHISTAMRTEFRNGLPEFFRAHTPPVPSL